MKQFALDMMTRLGIPKDAQDVFTKLSDKLNSLREYVHCINIYDGSDIQSENVIKKLDEISKKISENNYSVYYVFFLECLDKMYEKYIVKNIDTSVFCETIKDLKYKFDECLSVKGVFGTFVPNWFGQFYRADRFSLGRFQYEIVDFPYDRYEKDGINIKKGDLVLNIHIPSSGPMDKKSREASYKMALDFYKKNFNFTPKAFVCSTWLFNPDHYKFLSDSSNIIGFMNDFDIIEERIDANFEYRWRIFGKFSDLPFNKLPHNTSLQKAYADWMLAGNVAKTGYGIKIIKQKR